MINVNLKEMLENYTPEYPPNAPPEESWIELCNTQQVGFTQFSREELNSISWIAHPALVVSKNRKKFFGMVFNQQLLDFYDGIFSESLKFKLDLISKIDIFFKKNIPNCKLYKVSIYPDLSGEKRFSNNGYYTEVTTTVFEDFKNKVKKEAEEILEELFKHKENLKEESLGEDRKAVELFEKKPLLIRRLTRFNSDSQSHELENSGAILSATCIKKGTPIPTLSKDLFGILYDPSQVKVIHACINNADTSIKDTTSISHLTRTILYNDQRDYVFCPKRPPFPLDYIERKIQSIFKSSVVISVFVKTAYNTFMYIAAYLKYKEKIDEFTKSLIKKDSKNALRRIAEKSQKKHQQNPETKLGWNEIRIRLSNTQAILGMCIPEKPASIRTLSDVVKLKLERPNLQFYHYDPIAGALKPEKLSTHIDNLISHAKSVIELVSDDPQQPRARL